MQFTLLSTTALATFLTVVLSQSIDPSSVPLSTRDFWCNSQITQCPLICTQETDGSAATEANNCDASTLNYDCVCSNGLTPNASEYSQTIPYYICTQANSNCQAACGLNNNACAAACVQDHPCGAQSPTRVNASTITTSSSSTSFNAAATTNSAGSVIYNGFGGATTTPASSGNAGSSHSGAARLVGMGEVYGLTVVAAGIFAGFALLL